MPIWTVVTELPVLQVVQVLRAIDRDQGGQDTPVHFSIPPQSSSALNLTIRETGGSSHFALFGFHSTHDTSQNWDELDV